MKWPSGVMLDGERGEMGSDLTTTMSPLRHSLTSRTKKSALGLPMPMLTIEIGTPWYRPVMVMKPRSVASRNGLGDASNRRAMRSALEGDPTVICA